MKKYLLGFAALVLAIGLSSFTNTSKKAFADSFFAFNFTAIPSPTEAQVENEANWVLVSDLTTGCDDIDEKPCRIRVAQTYVSGSTLLSTAALIAEPSGGHYITGGNIVAKRNKQ